MAQAAEAGLVQAIVTTSGREAVEALLNQLLPERLPQLALRVCGEDVSRKKPDPQAYRRALELLNLAPGEVLAIEDSPQGLAAAAGSGIATLVTQSLATSEQPLESFAGAAALVTAATIHVAGLEVENVGANTGNLRLDLGLCSLTNGHHDHDGRHANDDAEHCQKAAHGIGKQRFRCRGCSDANLHVRPPAACLGSAARSRSGFALSDSILPSLK